MSLDAWQEVLRWVISYFQVPRLTNRAVSLPELIAQTNMDPQSVNRLREELVKITMWLNKDETVCRVFVSEYETADSEYVDKAKGDERR